MLIGLKSDDTLGNLILGIGITLATFHRLGTWEDAIIELTINVKCLEIHSLKN